MPDTRHAADDFATTDAALDLADGPLDGRPTLPVVDASAVSVPSASAADLWRSWHAAAKAAARATDRAEQDRLYAEVMDLRRRFEAIVRTAYPAAVPVGHSTAYRWLPSAGGCEVIPLVYAGEIPVMGLNAEGR
jgi:hypothetical protein